jgi:hypothetical protein
MTVDVHSLFTANFFLTYALGLLIIVMYSNDKFNMPTYDKESVGPFAQLPPQSLTIDSRYRSGRRMYIFLLGSLYTAICIIGPTTFNLDFGSLLSPGQPIQYGPQAKNNEIWPVAAATFLISTGVARDNSIIGRIELYIRQYAQKMAYIPNAVSDLAFSLRGLSLNIWLVKDPFTDANVFDERKLALASLIGLNRMKKFEENPEQEGELTAWLRANVLFYALQQIFSKRLSISNPRLEDLIELQENKDMFERLQNTQRVLADAADQAGLEKIYLQIQMFGRDASLMIAVLMSQTARNANDLAQRISQLGFSDIDPRDRSDHFGYMIIVNMFIGLAGVTAIILVFLPLLFIFLPPLARFGKINWTNADFGVEVWTIFDGLMLYTIMFKVLDYSRDKLLEFQDWTENLECYSKTTFSSSIVTSFICIVAAILLLSAFNWLDVINSSFAALVSFAVFQMIVATIGTGFGLYYMRQAARTPRSKISFRANLLSGTAFFHACLAAGFVLGLNYMNYYLTSINSPKKIYSSIMQDFSKVRQTMETPKSGAVFSVYSHLEVEAVAKGLASVQKGWSGDQYSENEIKGQLIAISAICDNLNKHPLLTVVPTEALKEPLQLADGKSNSDGQDLLFEAPNSSGGDKDSFKAGQSNECVLEDSSSNATAKEDPQRSKDIQEKEAQFFNFAGSLGTLYYALHITMPGGESLKTNYLAWGFPTIVTFILAYAFGIGCRYGRCRWLYDEADREAGHGVKLTEQIKKVYGSTVDPEKCLVFPIASLGNVTPLEAIRYEDYRAILFAKIQRQQIEWRGCKEDKIALETNPQTIVTRPGLI